MAYPRSDGETGPAESGWPASTMAAAGRLQPPGWEFLGSLQWAYRCGVKSRVAVVGTDLVACHTIGYLPTRWRRLPAPMDSAWRPVRRGRAGLADPSPPPRTMSALEFDAEVAFLADRMLREAEYRGAQPLRLRRRGKHRIRLPGFSAAVRHAVYEAIHEAGRRGVMRAGAPHLLVAVLSTPDGAAARLLDSWPLPARDSLISVLRADPTFGRAAPERPGLLARGLEGFGLVPGPAGDRWGRPVRLASRGVERWLIRRPYRRHGANYGHPFAALVELAAREQAVWLGRPSITAAEVLLGIVELHEQLVANRGSLPVEIARYNRGGEILQAHGLTRARLTRAAGQLTLLPADAEDQLDQIPSRGWPVRRSRPGLPTEGRTALLALRSASHAARDAGHPYAGTTHLLAGVLAKPPGPAYRLLWLAGADPDKIRAEAASALPHRDGGRVRLGRAGA